MLFTSFVGETIHVEFLKAAKNSSLEYSDSCGFTHCIQLSYPNPRVERQIQHFPVRIHLTLELPLWIFLIALEQTYRHIIYIYMCVSVYLYIHIHIHTYFPNMTLWSEGVYKNIHSGIICNYSNLKNCSTQVVSIRMTI